MAGEIMPAGIDVAAWAAPLFIDGGAIRHMAGMFAAAETPAEDDLEDALIGAWCQAETIAGIEFPAGIEFCIHGNEKLMLLFVKRAETLEGA